MQPTRIPGASALAYIYCAHIHREPCPSLSRPACIHETAGSKRESVTRGWCQRCQRCPLDFPKRSPYKEVPATPRPRLTCPDAYHSNSNSSRRLLYTRPSHLQPAPRLQGSLHRRRPSRTQPLAVRCPPARPSSCSRLPAYLQLPLPLQLQLQRERPHTSTSKPTAPHPPHPV